MAKVEGLIKQVNEIADSHVAYTLTEDYFEGYIFEGIEPVFPMGTQIEAEYLKLKAKHDFDFSDLYHNGIVKFHAIESYCMLSGLDFPGEVQWATLVGELECELPEELTQEIEAVEEDFIQGCDHYYSNGFIYINLSYSLVGYSCDIADIKEFYND